MTRFWTHPLPAALMLVCLLSTPVTYRGGAAEPHPHMFVQLWMDAAAGSFTHTAHKQSAHSNHDHHAAGRQKQAASAPIRFLTTDQPTPTLSAFVVSDYGVTVLLAPQVLTLEIETRAQAHRDRTVPPLGRETQPETPPPQRVA